MPDYMRSAEKVAYDHVRFAGGMDLITPTLNLQAGVLRDCQNFEVATSGGYSRILGYERFDGRPKPSDATYQIIQFASFVVVPAVGITVWDAAVHATTGVVIAVGADYIAVTKVVGTFAVGQTIQNATGPVTLGVMIAQTLAVTTLLNAQYIGLAAENYRADIAKPDAATGTGSVLGVATLIVAGVDNTYCFRNNNAAGVSIWKSSTSGWTNVPLMEEISYTAGAVATPVDGAVLTQGAVTATVNRIMVQTGSTFIGSTGRFIITARAGGNFAAGAATLSGGATCTITAVQTAITISPTGKYKFVTGNFFGGASSIRLYGCDGKNRMFEFDGTTYAPIATGSSIFATDITIFQNHLFGAFGASIVHSAPGLPYNYTTLSGSSEIATSDTITGIGLLPGTTAAGALGISGTRTNSILYGSGALSTTSPWHLTIFNKGAGGFAFTMQNMADTYMLDAAGVTSMTAVQEFGNFSQATLTANILPLIQTLRSLVVNSSLSRAKSQYRLFFSDGSALYLTVPNRKMLGSALQHYAHTVYCTSNTDTYRTNGAEDTFFGTTDGYVMQFDKGSSFDGTSIDAYIVPTWNFLRSPRLLKRYRKAAMEVQASAYVQFNFGYALGYNTTTVSQPTGALYETGFAGLPQWDTMVWDVFTWDGGILVPSEIELRGTAETIRPVISCNSTYVQAFTLNSLLIHYTIRRGMR